MFLSRYSFRIFLFLPLLFFSNCTNHKPTSLGKINELQIITDSSVSTKEINQIDSIYLTMQVRGIDESFFERIIFHSTPLNNTFLSKNLSVILNINSSVFSNYFQRYFSKEALVRVRISTAPVLFFQNDLFAENQLVSFILFSDKNSISSFFKQKLSTFADELLSRTLFQFEKEYHISEGEPEISELILSRWALKVEIPKGFEVVTKSKNIRYLLLRRGAGTKTEEWIFFSEIESKQLMNIDSSAFIQFRNRLADEIVSFSDSSKMKTKEITFVSERSLIFRGEWYSEPYPMGGMFSGKIIQIKDKTIYVEAGIYSPGRNKTMNLLRLEKGLKY
jgi:hypothetical protein